MEQINSLLNEWIFNKIKQYKIDQSKMTIEEAISSDLYVSRDKTIAFLTQKIIKSFNCIEIV